MGYVGYNEETDAVPEKGSGGSGRGPLVFTNKVHAEVELGKFQGIVQDDGRMQISTVAKVLGNDGKPISGAPWAKLSVTLPYQNPDRDEPVFGTDEKKANKARAAAYADCYKFMRALDEEAPQKYQWDGTTKQFLDDDGDVVDRDKAAAHNKECEQAGAAFVANIFNQCLETVDDPSAFLGAGSWGATKLIDVDAVQGKTFFTKIYHSGKTYTNKHGEEKLSDPRIYYVSRTAPTEADVAYEYEDLFEITADAA